MKTSENKEQKYRDVAYETNCPLCGEEVTVNLSILPTCPGIIEFPVVCQTCKDVWKELRNKYATVKKV